MYCKNCGKELKDDAVFCSGCGSPIKAAVKSSAETVAAASAEDKKLSVKEIVGGLLGIGLIIVLIISCRQFNDKKKETAKSKGASSYQDLMENYYHYMEKFDKKGFLKCMIPTSITKEHKNDDYYKEIEYRITNGLYDAKNILIDSDVSDYSIELDDIYDVSAVSSNKLNDIQDYYKNLYSNFGYKITPEIKQALSLKCNVEWTEGKKKGTWQESFIVAYLDEEGWYIAEWSD